MLFLVLTSAILLTPPVGEPEDQAMDPADLPLPEGQDLAVELVFQMLHNISAHLPAAAAPLPVAIGNASLYLPMPPRYNGDPKCTIRSEVLAHQFSSDTAKVALIISVLCGEALAQTSSR